MLFPCMTGDAVMYIALKVHYRLYIIEKEGSPTVLLS